MPTGEPPTLQGIAKDPLCASDQATANMERPSMTMIPVRRKARYTRATPKKTSQPWRHRVGAVGLRTLTSVLIPRRLVAKGPPPW
jgi:hypothetical protein